jgi:hypothetical protein
MGVPTAIVPDLIGQFVHIARDEALKVGLDLAGSDPDATPITSATWPGLYRVTAQEPHPGAVAHRGDQIRVTYVENGQARGDVSARSRGPAPRLSAHAEAGESNQ